MPCLSSTIYDHHAVIFHFLFSIRKSKGENECLRGWEHTSLSGLSAPPHLLPILTFHVATGRHWSLTWELWAYKRDQQNDQIGTVQALPSDKGNCHTFDLELQSLDSKKWAHYYLISFKAQSLAWPACWTHNIFLFIDKWELYFQTLIFPVNWAFVWDYKSADWFARSASRMNTNHFKLKTWELRSSLTCWSLKSLF